MGTSNSNKDAAESSSQKSRGSSSLFLDFFNIEQGGSVGRDVYDEYILPYLTLDDLVNGSGVCRQMNEMCRTYTVQDVLSLLFPTTSQSLSDDHKVGIGNLVIGSCYMSTSNNHHYLPQDIHSRGKKPIMVDAGFLKRLHHPTMFPYIVSAIRTYFKWQGIEVATNEQPRQWETRRRRYSTTTANTDNNTPLLVSAKYGLSRNNHNDDSDASDSESDDNYTAVDVTVIIRHFVVQNSNPSRLILQNSGHGYQYWYCCLFGDPAPGRPKTLTITTQAPDQDGILRSTCREFASETEITDIMMPLRVNDDGNQRCMEVDDTDGDDDDRQVVLPPSHAVERGHDLNAINTDGEQRRRRRQQQQAERYQERQRRMRTSRLLQTLNRQHQN